MTELSHDTESWREYRQEQQARREKRLPVRTAAILALRSEGFVVTKLTEYCFRINGRLDLYPVHNRWHDIQTNQRGGARDLVVFVREWRKQ
jgi:hypothetical protein